MTRLFQKTLQRRQTAMRTRRRSRAGAKRHRTRFERLEERLAPAGIVNGDFSVSNPADPGYGWTTQGNASIANDVGVLDEGTTVETQFSQTFTIPTGTQVLRFTIAASDLVSNGPNTPPDAFEAALLNSTTMDPLIGPPTGLSNTDSFLNIQQTGQVYYAPQVTVPGAGASGSVATLTFPNVISVDVSSVPANTSATVYFDLIGFSPATSSVQIANVVTLQSTTVPTANDQSVSMVGGTSQPITLIGADPDIPPLPLTYTVTTAPTHGTLSGTAPNLTYTPASGYLGSDSFQFTDNNGTATSPAATVSIDVVGTPTANSQSVMTTEGTPLPITLTGSDPNTPPLALTYTVTTAPTHGTLSGTAPDLTYTPNASYIGPDSFAFTDTNGTATSPAATVSIDVIGAPTANNQSLTTGEGTALAITLTGSDPNTPPLTLTYTVTTAPAHGTLSGTAPNLTYTPTAGYFGPDNFQFTDSNGVLTSSPATVSIGVGTPTANAQSVTTAEGTALAIALTGSDPNTPPLPLTYAVTVSPAHGTLSGTAPDLTYTPTSGYFGPDSFQFTDNNGVVTSDPATISINVVGAPTANAQSVTTAEDTAAAITLTGSDPNTPPLVLTYTVTVSPAHGTLSGTAPALTYTPTTGYFDTDSFQFTDSNGVLTSSPATVSIDVVGTPTANAQSVTTAEDTAAAITLTGSDPNTPSLALTYTVTVSPAHGTLSGTAPDLTYTPNASYFGPDSFQFTDSNGTATSPAATVSINVVGTPTANSQSLTTGEGTALAITLTGSDPNTPPLPLTYTVTTAPTHGMLSGTAPDLTYTPTAGYFGPDSFQFTDSNGVATSIPATVSISVGAPTANAQSVTTAEGSAVAITLTGSDPNTPPLPLTYSVTVSPAHGTLSGTAPDLTYTPASGYFGADSFQFTDNNGVVTSSPATVSIDVVGTPTANTQSVTTAEGTALVITLTGTDPNTPPLALTYTVTVSPAHGTLSGTAPNLTYSPTTGYFGTDSFAFTDSNGTATSPAATVSIDVVGTPTANAQSVTTAEGTAVPITLTGTDPNTPPLLLTFTVTVIPAHGTLSGTVPNLTYTPAAGYSGPDSFTYQASNGTARSNVATVSLTITPANQPPVSVGSAYTTLQNRVLTVPAPGVLTNVVSSGPVTPTAILVSGPVHGSLVLNTDGSFTYTPAANFHGPDSFSFRAVAGTAMGNVSVVQLTVTPAPVRLLPDTPYFNYVRRRRSIDPARFDTYHPQIGAILRLENAGIPTTPTVLVSVNHHFDVQALRALYANNPAQFDMEQPVLGALFQLESPGSGPPPSHLLPVTPQYNALRALYAENPEQFKRRDPYFGALFALENIENGVEPTSSTTVKKSSIEVKVGAVHPQASRNLPFSRRESIRERSAARHSAAAARR
jgi:Bacterial Ig domain